MIPAALFDLTQLARKERQPCLKRGHFRAQQIITRTNNALSQREISENDASSACHNMPIRRDVAMTAARQGDGRTDAKLSSLSLSETYALKY
jgi:hypothetical protein